MPNVASPKVVLVGGAGKTGRSQYGIYTRRGRVHVGAVWQSLRQPGRWDGGLPYRWVIEGASSRAEAVSAVVAAAQAEVAEAEA